MGCAIAGAYAAVNGLFTWKKQKEWSEDRDLAKKAYTNLRKMRDVLSEIRHPMITTGEFHNAMKDNDDETTDLNYLKNAKVYEKRWEKLTAVRQELYPDIIESEAIWGPELKALIAPILDHINDLYIAVRLHVDSLHPKNKNSDLHFKKNNENMYILYETGGDKDKFSAKLGELYLPLEDYLKSKLGRRK